MLKIVDLFTGIGGLKQGVTLAAEKAGYKTCTVLTSEVKTTALKVLNANWPEEPCYGDITKINTKTIPTHDLLLASLPRTINHSQSTPFYHVEKIIRYHLPKYVILELLENMLTQSTEKIVNSLQEIGYKTSWGSYNASDFGVPQSRKRVFIAGSLITTPALETINLTPSLPLYAFLEKGVRETDSQIIAFEKLLKQSHPNLNQLQGKIFRDWRGGDRHIHSWNINFKGKTSPKERDFLETLMIESKKTKWKTKTSEGAYLTLDQILSFIPHITPEETKHMLEKLVSQTYVKQHQNTYKISSGKLTMPLNHILDKETYTTSLTSIDANRLGIIDNNHIRRFTPLEVKRLFGYPNNFIIPPTISRNNMFELFGSTTVIPMAEKIASSLF